MIVTMEATPFLLCGSNMQTLAFEPLSFAPVAFEPLSFAPVAFEPLSFLPVPFALRLFLLLLLAAWSRVYAFSFSFSFTMTQHTYISCDQNERFGSNDIVSMKPCRL